MKATHLDRLKQVGAAIVVVLYGLVLLGWAWGVVELFRQNRDGWLGHW